MRFPRCQRLAMSLCVLAALTRVFANPLDHTLAELAVNRSLSVHYVGNTTTFLGRVPDPISQNTRSADRGRCFQGRVTFIADHFRLPGILPVKAATFFDDASLHFERLQHFSASHNNDAIENCMDNECRYITRDLSGATYSMVLEHTDLVYHFLYGDIDTMFAWLSTLPDYVHAGESLGFGSFRLRVIFNGRDLLNDEPIVNALAYNGNIIWPQPENSIETS